MRIIIHFLSKLFAIVKALENNPLASKLALSPFTGGARIFSRYSIPFTLLPPLKGEVAERSEAEGLSLKKNFF